MPRYECDCYLDLNKLVYNNFHTSTWPIDAENEEDAVGKAKYMHIADLYTVIEHLTICRCKEKEKHGGGGR